MNKNLKKIATMAIVTCNLLSTCVQAFAKYIKKSNPILKIEDKSENTSGVTTSIQADSNQWSKLGISADLLFQKCLFKETKYGEVVNQYYGYRQKTLNTYLDVIYK